MIAEARCTRVEPMIPTSLSRAEKAVCVTRLSELSVFFRCAALRCPGGATGRELAASLENSCVSSASYEAKIAFEACYDPPLSLTFTYRPDM